MGIIQRIRAGRRPAEPIQPKGAISWGGPVQWGPIPLPDFSAQTVLGLPAANRAVTMISNAVASMAPMRLWTPDGYISDQAPNIIVRPNSLYTTFDFFAMLVQEVIVNGNFLAVQADFDVKGYPQQVVP